MRERHDCIIIGTGQSGPALANRLSREGLRTAVIERKLVGGTCVNVGCIPTKTLVASARAAHVARRGADFGVRVPGPVEVDMKRVKDRMKRISGQSNHNVTRWLEGMDNVELIRGHARFVGPRSVRVGDRTLEADKIFLNVGARASVPDLPGVADIDYLTNSTILEVDSVPPHLVVIGGSYIGLEFGQMYRRFGSEVTIVERGPALIGRDDPDVSATVREILEAEGIDIRLDSECVSFERRGDQIAVGVSCEDGTPQVLASHVLLAVGRVPNTDDLGLAEAGVAVDERGFVEVDDQLRTSADGVWALGDCNGKGAFTHTSYNDYEIVAANLLEGADRKWTDRVPVYALYTDPPLGRVGMSEAEIRKAGIEALVGKRPMSRVARAREKGETQGLLKIHVEAASKRILGAALLGTGCDEAVHSLIDVVYARTPYPEFQRRVRIHPTVSELLPTVLESLEPLA